MLRTRLRDSIDHVGQALREPEEFALRWHRGEIQYAWSIPLPALYILNSFSGSRLRVSTTFLAALVTTSWGGLAMIASIPINWFFTVSFPQVFPAGWVPHLVLLVNLAVFTGVAVAMIDVFGRVMEAVEPRRGRGPLWWLVVVGAIGGELFYAFGLFQFATPA